MGGDTGYSRVWLFKPIRWATVGTIAPKIHVPSHARLPMSQPLERPLGELVLPGEGAFSRKAGAPGSPSDITDHLSFIKGLCWEASVSDYESAP